MDALEDEESDKVEVRGYCSVDNLLDFGMDLPAKAKHESAFCSLRVLRQGLSRCIA